MPQPPNLSLSNFVTGIPCTVGVHDGIQPLAHGLQEDLIDDGHLTRVEERKLTLIDYQSLLRI